MKKYGCYGYGAYILHNKEKHEGKTSLERAPIGKLMSHDTFGQHPSDKQAGGQTSQRRQHLGRDIIKALHQRSALQLQALCMSHGQRT